MNIFEQHDPKTAAEAVAIIESLLSPESLEMGKIEGFNAFHFSLGMAIRNAWLWDDPRHGRVQPLAEHFRTTYGIGHADDMSGMLLDALTHKVRQAPGAWKAEKQAKVYHDFWREQGIDPLTQEPLPDHPARR